MKEFKANEYITLKLEESDEHNEGYYITNIYIKNEKFRQCIRLVLQIPQDNVKDYNDINSIDEASERFKTLYQNQIIEGVNPIQ
jgi:hypothetical protein